MKLSNLKLAVVLVASLSTASCAAVAGVAESAIALTGMENPAAESFKVEVFQAYLLSWGSVIAAGEAHANLIEANGRRDEAGLLRAQMEELGSGPVDDAGEWDGDLSTDGLSEVVQTQNDYPFDTEAEVEGSVQLLLLGAGELAAAVLLQIETVKSLRDLAVAGPNLVTSLASDPIAGAANAAALGPFIAALPSIIAMEISAIRSAGGTISSLVGYFRSRDIPVPDDVSDALGAFDAFTEEQQ